MALPSPVMQQANGVFGGGVAAGIFAELLKRFGPTLAEWLLKLILSKQRAGMLLSPPPDAGAAPLIVSVWIASILESHREEVLDLIRDQAGTLLDLGIAALRAG